MISETENPGGGETVPPDSAESGEARSDGDGSSTSGWRDAVPADLRKMADRFASPADAVKSASDLRQRLSRSITPPTEGADQAEWDEFYGKLGRPETADGYDIHRPESLAPELHPDARGEARENSFLEAMHGAGAPPGIVQAAIDWYYNEVSGLHAEQIKGHDTALEQANDRLRAEWGGDFDKNIELARRAFNAFGDDDFQKFADHQQLTNHPAFVRAFARIGRQMGEDEMINGSTDGGANADLEAEAEKLLTSKDYWTNNATQRRMREIMEQLHGTEPINPSER